MFLLEHDLFFLVSEGSHESILDNGQVPEFDGEHGSQDRASPIHYDVLSIGVATAVPFEARC